MNQKSAQASKNVTSTFRIVRKLLIVYAVVGWLGFVAVVLISATVAKHHPDVISPTTWIHGLIVALTGIPFVSVADKAARAKGRAAIRLRIIVTVVPIAFIADIFLLSLPAWMDIEQAVCATLLAIAAVVYFTVKPRA